MNRIPRARYTKEVREEAVNLAKAVGASEASRRLSIPLKTLANWLRASGNGKLTEIVQQQKQNFTGSSGSWQRSRWSGIC